MKDFGEPWKRDRNSIVDKGNNLLSVHGRGTVAFNDEEMDHIVACVNACSGINPEAVPGLVAAAGELDEVISYCDADYPNPEDGETLFRAWEKLKAALALARKEEG